MFKNKQGEVKKSFVFLNNSKIAINPEKVSFLKSNGENLTLYLEGGFVEEVESRKDIDKITKIFDWRLTKLLKNDIF